MKTIELLAPAGSFEALKAAIANGCNAVYLGGTEFGARAFANNFDKEQLNEAVAYAHVYGVRIFVTMNTLMHNDEFHDALAYAAYLQRIDVDALIIQDFGFFQAVRQALPDMELHASTQMHIHNEAGIRYMKQQGAKRVVLPRETPLSQIRSYAKEGVDLEVFIQGALCISYSGQCLMSAMTLARSGNQGACAQSCRMQYTLEKEEHGVFSTMVAKGAYLLSTKDLNTLEQVPPLIEAGITSFKIEGRMKRPEYVALMTACYRKAIDAYMAGTTFHVHQSMKEEMEKIFNRGFTAGYLYHQKGSKLMNMVRPNHMGIGVGQVIFVTRDRMRIKLTKTLWQGDGIRVLNDREDEGFRVNKLYKQGLLVNHGDAGDVVEIEKSSYVEKGSQVLKTSDVLQLQQLQKTYEKNQRKVIIQATFTMKKGEYAQLCVFDDQHTIVKSAKTVVEKARKMALDEERIATQLQKTNDTPFAFSNIRYDLDEDAIFPIKELNQIRRDALHELYEARQQLHQERHVKTYIPVCEIEPPTYGILCVIQNEEQYITCYNQGMKTIFTEHISLYHTLLKKGYTIYLRRARVMKEAYGHELELVQEHGALYQHHHGAPFICDTSLNVLNIHSLAALYQAGATGVVVSYELSMQDTLRLVDEYQNCYHHHANIIMPIYGRVELMISEYCPIHAVCVDNDKKNCQLCRGFARYYLKDLKGHRFPLLNDEQCRMRLYDDNIRDWIDDIPRLKQHDINQYMLMFTTEQASEIECILKRVCYHGE